MSDTAKIKIIGDLEDKLIGALSNSAPDFERAEELIKQGADINAMKQDGDDNVLSSILQGYWWCAQRKGEPCDSCDNWYCYECEHGHKNEIGPWMCSVIQFCLDHGFDVTKCDNKYGAQCLYWIVLSTFNRYMIEGAKMLFDAGAKDATAYKYDDYEETASHQLYSEQASTFITKGNCSWLNILEAFWQVYEAVEQGKPYKGIDSYEKAIGKRVVKVLAEKEFFKPVFRTIKNWDTKRRNCFSKPLYLVFEDGVLVVDRYTNFWTDTVLPDTRLADVSHRFFGVVGAKIKSFEFKNNIVEKGESWRNQHITVIQMDSKRQLIFSNNHKEVEDTKISGFFDIKYD